MAESTPRRSLGRRSLLGLGLGAAALGGGALALRGDDTGSRWAEDAATALYGMRVRPRLAFAELPGSAGRLDLFLPAGPGPFPVLLWTAGSGWESDRGFEGGHDVARGLVPHGVAVAAFSVRSSAQAVFPAQVRDAAAAVAWTRAHAAELEVDPGRIALGGNSSGGWNALMAALTGGVGLVRGQPASDTAPVPPEAAVGAVVDVHGPVDFPAMNAQMPEGACAALDRSRGTTHCHLDARSTKSLMLGTPVLQDPGLVRLATPRTHLRAGSPPVLVVHGEADRTVPWGQSAALADDLRRHDVPSAFYSVPGADHDMGMMRPGRGQAHVRRHRLGPEAVRDAISWEAVAAFLHAVLPRG